MGRCCGPAAAKSPSPVPLTLIVSLEAIFLSTFVMIGQPAGGVPAGQGGS